MNTTETREGNKPRHRTADACHHCQQWSSPQHVPPSALVYPPFDLRELTDVTSASLLSSRWLPRHLRFRGRRPRHNLYIYMLQRTKVTTDNEGEVTQRIESKIGISSNPFRKWAASNITLCKQQGITSSAELLHATSDGKSHGWTLGIVVGPFVRHGGQMKSIWRTGSRTAARRSIFLYRMMVLAHRRPRSVNAGTKILLSSLRRATVYSGLTNSSHSV